MAYKNVFSFEPSELHTAEKIRELGKNYEVFFPIKDEAVDLIVTKNLAYGERKVITVQVKASRMFEKGVEKGLPRFWIKLDPKKMEGYSKKIDFYVFVFYKTIYETEKVPHFEREYIVIPTIDLIQKSKNKKGWQRGWLNYYFLLYPDGSILDLRDVSRKNLEAERKKSWRVYTQFRNAFRLLK
jgi:hypothetical protein